MTDHAPARKPVSKRLRFEIFRRDGFRCRYCGLSADETGSGLTIDHVTPVALGGDNRPGNLFTACKDCNAGKSSSSPDEHHIAQVSDDVIRWGRAIFEAAELRRGEIEVREFAANDFDSVWSSWHDTQTSIDVPRDPDWRFTIGRFCDAGLDILDLERYVEIAMRSRASIGDKWKYFCGCCWNEITERQNLAREMIAASEPEEVDHHPDDPWLIEGIMASFAGGHSDCYVGVPG